MAPKPKTDEEIALDAIREAEAKVRKAGASAMAEGRYASCQRLVELAKGLAEMADDWRTARGSDHGKAPMADRSSTPSGQRRGKGRKREAEYFRRGSDTLVRRGWSKGKKRAYAHTMSFDMVSELARLCSKARYRKGFVVDDILKDEAAETAGLTQFTVYLGLGWLKLQGWVLPGPSRGRYRMGDSTDWDSLLPSLKASFHETPKEPSE